MRCIPASSAMPQGSKAEQIPAPHNPPAGPRGTSPVGLPGVNHHGPFPEDFWPRSGPTLLSFPTDSPVLLVLPCSRCHSQEVGNQQASFYGGPFHEQVGLLVHLQLSGLKVVGYCSLSGGFCYCGSSQLP